MLMAALYGKQNFHSLVNKPSDMENIYSVLSTEMENI